MWAEQAWPTKRESNTRVAARATGLLGSIRTKDIPWVTAVATRLFMRAEARTRHSPSVRTVRGSDLRVPGRDPGGGRTGRQHPGVVDHLAVGVHGHKAR